MKYENRVVLFLDILGFRKHVEETFDIKESVLIDKEEQIKSLYEVLFSMGEIAGVNRSRKGSVLVTQFSDSIVISFDGSEHERAVSTIEIIMRIIVLLVNKKIICRGALSFGKLIHNDKIIFGPAFIDAYETELHATMYPRIIMDKNIYNFCKIDPFLKKDKVEGNDDGTVLLSIDLDGKYYIDYFQSICQIIRRDDELIRYYEMLREIIIYGRRFQQPDLRVKYGWMRMKYNDFLDNVRFSQGKMTNVVFSGPVKSYFQKLNPIK